MNLTAAGMENAMMTSGSGPIAPAANAPAPRTPNGAFRRRAALIRAAAIFLLVLAPIGCGKDEADHPGATTDLTTEGSDPVVEGGGAAGGETTYEPLTTDLTGPDPVVEGGWAAGGLSTDLGPGQTEVAAGSAAGATTGCAMAGTWEQTTETIGTTTWEITESGQATESGIGWAKGTATITGGLLWIDWSTENGYSGDYRWVLNADCTAGKGELVFRSGRPGTHRSTVKRVSK